MHRTYSSDTQHPDTITAAPRHHHCSTGCWLKCAAGGTAAAPHKPSPTRPITAGLRTCCEAPPPTAVLRTCCEAPPPTAVLRTCCEAPPLRRCHMQPACSSINAVVGCAMRRSPPSSCDLPILHATATVGHTGHIAAACRHSCTAFQPQHPAATPGAGCQEVPGACL
jgi:hypothetical protein